jgi:hypothetical protein
VLEGEAFDCAVMTFVDEHCEAFDSIDEENKLEFTDLHSAFIEHVEALIIAECTDLVWYSISHRTVPYRSYRTA